MELHEDIKRIRQIMGVNESFINSFKRRTHELPDYIRKTYKRFTPKPFINLDAFITKVAFYATNDLMAEMPGVNIKDIISHREDIAEFVRDYIRENLLDEIKYYYENDGRDGDET